MRVQGFKVQGFRGSRVKGFTVQGFKRSRAVEGRQLFELKYVEMIHFQSVAGSNGRVGISPCLKTAPNPKP